MENPDSRCTLPKPELTSRVYIILERVVVQNPADDEVEEGLSVAYGVDEDGAGGSEHFGYKCVASLQVFRSSTRRNKPGHWTVPQVTSHRHHLSESGRAATFCADIKILRESGNGMDGMG